MSKVIGWLVVIVLVGGGIYVWSRSQSRSDCEDRALIAATDTYPISEYPDTAERGRLQDTYMQTYMETCQ